MGSLQPTLVVDKDAFTLDGSRTTPSANVATARRPKFPVLEGGKSYILSVKLKTPKFANSNIYWNDIDQKLTFDAYIDSVANPGNYVSNKEQQRQQGVLFKWGSLIGIAAPGNGTSPIYWTDETTVYVPLSPDNPKTDHESWEAATVTTAQSSWSSYWGIGYHGIPYALGNDYAAYGSGQNNKYLSLMPDSTGFYKGDICQYLDKDYRMPYSYEFGNGAAAAWSSNTPNSNITTDASGRDKLAENRCATLNVNGMLFPASGARLTLDANLYRVGYDGRYWSSSASNTTNSYRLYFLGTGVTLGSTDSRYYGFSVRCVLRE
jgi:hypothetical protein